MANIATITLRAAVTTQALATMGVDPEWDRLLTKYLATEALYFADASWGGLYQAGEVFALERMRLEATAGPNWMTSQKTRVRANEVRKALQKVEDESDERFVLPYWAAARELVKCPAPSLAAALFKSNLIHAEEVWNDVRMDAGCMQIVTEDMARLAA